MSEKNSPLRVALYARVSTKPKDSNHRSQDPMNQVFMMREYCTRLGWQITSEFIDQGHSGTKQSRPALDRLMQAAKNKEFDVILCYKFDRFARSVKHLVSALEELQNLGVRFVSMTENLDFGTPIGRAMFAVIAAMAQLERDLISERTRDAAKTMIAAGKRWGRRKSEFDINALREMHGSGSSLRAIASELNISRMTVKRALQCPPSS